MLSPSGPCTIHRARISSLDQIPSKTPLNSIDYGRASRHRLIDQQPKERPPDRALQEDLLEFPYGILPLEEHQQGKAESGAGKDILGVDFQAFSATRKDVGEVVPDVVFEPSDDLSRGEPGVEEERGKVIGAALRVTSRVPVITPAN